MSRKQQFPPAVRDAMSASGAMATCVPVQFEPPRWQAAFFFQVAGPESKQDRRAMRRGEGPFTIGLETDVVETEHGAVVILRPELHINADDPLVMEILLTPGEGGAHHEALRYLSEQPSLNWLFARSRLVGHSRAVASTRARSTRRFLPSCWPAHCATTPWCV